MEYSKCDASKGLKRAYILGVLLSLVAGKLFCYYREAWTSLWRMELHGGGKTVPGGPLSYPTPDYGPAECSCVSDRAGESGPARRTAN